VKCSRCQEEIQQDAAFCQECGAQTTAVAPGARHKFCLACGRPLGGSSGERSPSDPIPPNTGFIGKHP